MIERYQSLFPELLYKLISVTVLPYMYIFLFGMFVYRFRDRLIPFFCRYKWLFIAAYFVWYYLPYSIKGHFQGVHYNIVTTVLLMCAVFSVGYGFGKKRFKADYSYAFYLYHGIVVNLAKHLHVDNMLPGPELVLCMAIEIGIAFALSWLSVTIIDGKVSKYLKKKLFRLLKITA